MQLNPSEISELLKSKIQGLGVGTEMRTQGTVVSVTDGICRVHGLADVERKFGRRIQATIAIDKELIGATVRSAVRRFINQRFQRKPVVLPLVLTV